MKGTMPNDRSLLNTENTAIAATTKQNVAELAGNIPAIKLF